MWCEHVALLPRGQAEGDPEALVGAGKIARAWGPWAEEQKQAALGWAVMTVDWTPGSKACKHKKQT